jgi:hypothetical protein
MDPESRYDAVANVGIVDGKIAVITKDEIAGKETIDVSDHVVAPGFIDTHWHYDRPWSNKLALRDGRTTVLDLEIGTHGPYLDQWYKQRKGKNQVNYGQAVGYEFARAAGSFAEALRLARENNIPLMQIIAMTSYNSAAPLGRMGLTSMQKRGRLQEGMIADITVFDPETVTDKATYAKGTLPSEGIPYVVVNGTLVVKDSKVLRGVKPGQPIRFEAEESASSRSPSRIGHRRSMPRRWISEAACPVTSRVIQGHLTRNPTPMGTEVGIRSVSYVRLSFAGAVQTECPQAARAPIAMMRTERRD